MITVNCRIITSVMDEHYLEEEPVCDYCLQIEPENHDWRRLEEQSGNNDPTGVTLEAWYLAPPTNNTCEDLGCSQCQFITLSTTAPNSSSPRCSPSPPTMNYENETSVWKHVGCYTDDFSDVNSEWIMALPVLVNLARGMNVSECFQFCHTDNYKYFAMQIGVQCWCGNDKTTATQCGGKDECDIMEHNWHELCCGTITAVRS